MPQPVRRAVERRLGSRVDTAIDQPGGFSPGVAARLLLADGRRVFVKAVGASPNAESPQMHRREARIAGRLPPEAPVPRILFAVDDGDWVALAFEDVEGRHPRLPWDRSELQQVLDALTDLSAALSPSPVEVPAISERFDDQFRGWRTLAADPSGGTSFLDPWARRNLRRLAELEARWPDACRGETLLHADLRADNILVGGGRVYFIDWPHACRGAPWVDLLFMLPSVSMQRGPDPWGLFDEHALSGSAEREEVEAILAAVAGFFVWKGSLPAPPGLPTLREFQRAQGAESLRWLRRRLG